MNQLNTIILFLFCSFFTTKAQTVYVTKSGNKYHKSSCRFLKYSKNEITIKRAKNLGYWACKVCKPTIKNTPAKNTTSLSLTPNQKKQAHKKKTKIIST